MVSAAEPTIVPPDSPPRRASLWKLGGLTPLRLLFHVLRGMLRDELLSRASALAFDFMFALFPLMIFMLALFGLFTSGDNQLQGTLLSYFSVLLPPSAFQLFNSVFNELAAHSDTQKLTIGFVAGLWFASGGMNSMISAMNVVYRVQDARSWLRVRTIALALTLAMSILMLSALLLVLIGDHVVDWLAAQFSWRSLLQVGWKDLRWPAAALFVMFSFSLVYYFGPDSPDRRWRWVTPGSLFGVLLWLASSLGLRVYLGFINTYSVTYGSLGAVIILMCWLYATGLAFLIGAEINAEIDRAAAANGRPSEEAKGAES